MNWKDIFYPKRAVCLGCRSMVGQDADWLCPNCLQKLEQIRVAENTRGWNAVDRVCGAVLYRSPADALVKGLKYHGLRELAQPMVSAMVGSLEREIFSADVIVPVPMHRFRRWKRGYNHAELLAKGISERMGIPMLCALRRVRNTRQQARLNHEQRLHNLDGAFRIKGDVRGKSILLVDDVCTTGATAEACAIVLRNAGARSVRLCVYALAKKQN